MRYIADYDGYVKQVSFGADIACGDDTCTEYTGSVPAGYKTLEAWFLEETEKLYRWKIVDGNLTLDSSAVPPREHSNDTGWIELSLTPEFKAYAEGSTPKYRKVGNLVEVRGAVACTSAIEGGSTEHTIFSLPSGCYPTDIEHVFVCQGSGQNLWTLRVKTTGAVSFSRYRDASGYTATSTSTWLPFRCMFFADGDISTDDQTTMTATHDGAGNVTVYGVTATHDGAGNVTIT